MITESDVCKRYELFFSIVTGFKDYSFTPTIQQRKIISNFLVLLDANFNLNSIDDNFLYDYFSFHFSRKFDRKTRFGKGIVPLNHICGKKALQEWLNKDEYWKYFVDEFLDKFKIKRKQFEPYKLETLKNIEEEERKRFFNTDQGFLNCLTIDIKYSVKSKYCLICKYRKDCKNK